MKTSFYLLCLGCLFIGCKINIKNTDASVVQEQGTEPAATTVTPAPPDSQPHNAITGFWVGDFLKDTDREPDDLGDKNLYVDEGFIWNRQNKINISIDQVTDGKVLGHSVVAGNNRPFTGTVTNHNDTLYFEVKEPGDNQYDGTFSFTLKDTVLQGTWQSFKKNDISARKYTLKKAVFAYNPAIMLQRSRRFVNWEKSKKKYDAEMEEFEASFASATDVIYEVNASAHTLSKTDVENMKKGDLFIIRNTIYARHGYSFKNRPLRVFFDAQEWYIPVHTDIKSDFTSVEKSNIELLLRYEKNAKEYYDYFGRS